TVSERTASNPALFIPTSWTTRDSKTSLSPSPASRVPVLLVPSSGRRRDRVELFELLRRQVNIRRREVLLEVLSALGSRNREDLVAAGEDPCQRDLSGCGASAPSDLLNMIRERLIRGDLFRPEAGKSRAEIGGIEAPVRAELAGQEASAERR